MSYPPNHGPGHYPPQAQGPHQPPGGYQYPAQPRNDGANTLARVIHVITGTVAAIFVLHILFVVFHANRGNEFVSLVYVLAKTFVLGLGDIFTPGDATLGVVLNYGIAALVYLVVGRLIAKAIARS
jgi:hypothetical protein